jgi:hypothetical protein
MMGPFDSLTTSRSGERDADCAGAAGAAAAGEAWSVGVFVHPEMSVPAEATRAASPNSLRLRVGGAGFGAGAQVPHPVVLQLPQPLPEAGITLSRSSISTLLSSRPFLARTRLVSEIRLTKHLGSFLLSVEKLCRANGQNNEGNP